MKKYIFQFCSLASKPIALIRGWNHTNSNLKKVQKSLIKKIEVFLPLMQRKCHVISVPEAFPSCSQMLSDEAVSWQTCCSEQFLAAYVKTFSKRGSFLSYILNKSLKWQGRLSEHYCIQPEKYVFIYSQVVLFLVTFLCV